MTRSDKIVTAITGVSGTLLLAEFWWFLWPLI